MQKLFFTFLKLQNLIILIVPIILIFTSSSGYINERGPDDCAARCITVSIFCILIFCKDLKFVISTLINLQFLIFLLVLLNKLSRIITS